MVEMNEIMIDLETLGLGEKAVFPVLCAYKFDSKTGAVGDCFYANIDIHDQIERGREIDVDTLAWWFNQGKDARDELMREGESLSSVINKFADFVHEDAIVWSNGIDFDLPKLRSVFRKNKTPWKFWNQRDIRTVVALASDCFDPKEIEFVGVKHNAKDDCLHQIKVLHLALCALHCAEYQYDSDVVICSSVDVGSDRIEVELIRE